MELSSFPHQDLESNFPLINGLNTETSLSVIPQAEKPELDKSLSLLDIDIQGKKFYLCQTAKNSLESLEGPCYVISVSGNPQVGKSTLLNLLLSLFHHGEKNAYQNMFPVGDGKRRMTDGIDMCCLSKNGKNFIFLDIEGDNDSTRRETGVWIYSNLIQSAVGISHVHLYNYNGIPQESFYSYFETINRIVNQNNLHADFQTKYSFIRRNCMISAEEFQEFKSPLDERLSESGIDYSLYLLPSPPQHILAKKSKASCLELIEFLFEDRQAHEFKTALIDFSHELEDTLRNMVPFENGSQVAEMIERLLEINQREIPFSLNKGHISKMRLEKIDKEKNRVQQNVFNIINFERERRLPQGLQNIFEQSQSLTNTGGGQDFKDDQSSATETISVMAYLFSEFSQFIEQYLLDDRGMILDEEEKKTLCSAYVVQFFERTKTGAIVLRNFDKRLESLCKDLVDIMKSPESFMEYMSAASNDFKILVGVLLELGVSGAVEVLSKSMTTKIVSVVFVGGGAATGIVFTAQACRKIYEKMKEAKKIMEEFITKLVEALNVIRVALAPFFSEEGKRRIFDLIDSIPKAMDEKIAGRNLSGDFQAQILERVKDTKDNIQRLQDCFGDESTFNLSQ